MIIQVRRSYKMCQRYIHLYGYTSKTVVLEVPILSDRLALSGFPLVAETDTQEKLLTIVGFTWLHLPFRPHNPSNIPSLCVTHYPIAYLGKGVGDGDGHTRRIGVVSE